MTSLEQAKQEVRKAESLVAQYAGEEKALEGQKETLAKQMQGLGIDPDQADAALAALDAEIVSIEQEIAAATRELETALAG